MLSVPRRWEPCVGRGPALDGSAVFILRTMPPTDLLNRRAAVQNVLIWSAAATQYPGVAGTQIGGSCAPMSAPLPPSVTASAGSRRLRLLRPPR